MTDKQAASSISCQQWTCCSKAFTSLVEIQRHVSRDHQAEVTAAVSHMRDGHVKDIVAEMGGDMERPDSCLFGTVDQDKVRVALSKKLAVWRCEDGDGQRGLVLLFYKYADISNPQALVTWQQKLCDRLSLTGKVRKNKLKVKIVHSTNMAWQRSSWFSS